MAVTVVLVLVALVVALWVVATLGGLFFALIPWVIMGLLTGWIAARLTGTRLSTGRTILAGIAGSLLGPALFAWLLPIRVGGLLNPIHLIASVLGAAIVITFVRVVARPSLTGSSRQRLPRMY